MKLVTGGAGFIGGNYLWNEWNHGEDEHIICVDKLTYASDLKYIQPLIDNGFVTFIQEDIGNKDKMCAFMKNLGVDYVVNFAAESHVDNSIVNMMPFVNTNIIGTINLMQAALEYGGLKKFLHVSTDEVYGSLSLEDKDGFSETTPYKPRNPYSASKAASDHFVNAFYNTYGLPAVITNCSNNYGPGQHKEKLIPTIITKALANEKIPVYGDGLYVRDWLYVDDHCRGISMVLEDGRLGEKYNIGGGTELPNIEIVNIILEKLGKSKSLIEYVKDRPGHDRRYSIDCSKISSELGYKAEIDLEKGIELTIKEFTK
jgi:dTDP-glucose 4,6-dehydratase